MYRKSSIKYSGSNVGRSNYSRSKGYVSESSGLRRHEITSVLQGTPAAILPNEYIFTYLLQFKRAFGAADDSEPTATASNNYQTWAVMNGSKVGNFTAKIDIANQSASQPAYLDVYTVAVSFYDVLVWNTILPTQCPFTFDSTTTGPPNLQGAVSAKAVSATLITENGYKNYKIVQHYMKKVGTIYMSPSDGGKSNAQIVIDRVPAKCKRSQTGMLFAVILHNPTTKNNAATLNVDATLDLSFNEYPSSNRLPFIY